MRSANESSEEISVETVNMPYIDPQFALASTGEKSTDCLSSNWRIVIVYGTFEEVSNEETQENVLTMLYSRAPHMTPVESMLVKDMKGTVVLRIKMEDLTGMAEEW
jgi:nitroimidazol reductase NimA-like FMN-containing flavoprotein (pyridoxamine 5'-phosphate oxidase superfamily)